MLLRTTIQRKLATRHMSNVVTRPTTDLTERALRIKLGFDPPDALPAIARELAATPELFDDELKWRVISGLRRAAFLDGRWDAVRELAATMPNAHIRVFDTHAEAVAALSAEQDQGLRVQLFAEATATRYPEALFMRSEDLIAALPAFEPAVHRPIVKYLSSVALNVTRAQTSWEREAGVSPKKLQIRAAKDMRRLDKLLSTRYSSVLDVHLSIREGFLATLGVLQHARIDARRHWKWLLQHGRVDAALIDTGLRAMRDPHSVRRAWQEGISAWKDYDPSLRWGDGVLARHLARVGDIEGASLVLATASVNVPWYIYALKGAGVDRVPDFIQTRFRRYLDLKASGFDFPSIEWMMSRFSPIQELNELSWSGDYSTFMPIAADAHSQTNP